MDTMMGLSVLAAVLIFSGGVCIGRKASTSLDEFPVAGLLLLGLGLAVFGYTLS